MRKEEFAKLRQDLNAEMQSRRSDVELGTPYRPGDPAWGFSGASMEENLAAMKQHHRMWGNAIAAVEALCDSATLDDPLAVDRVRDALKKAELEDDEKMCDLYDSLRNMIKTVDEWMRRNNAQRGLRTG